jgi:FtsP/CotA-like multicopper oxidase with cupredoxin domain
VLSYSNNTAVFGDIPYTETSSQAMDYGGNLINNSTIVNEFGLVPYPSMPPPATSDHTLFMSVGLPDVRVWNMDGVSYLPWRDQSTPAIIDPSIALAAGVAAKVEFGTTVDIIFNLTSGNPVHPMHKHDNKGWIIGQGNGEFTYASVAEAMNTIPNSFNLATAPYRDTYRTPATFQGPAWMAVRYEVNTLGPVFMHCHIDNHLQGGMAFVIMQGLEVGFPTPPMEQ